MHLEAIRKMCIAISLSHPQVAFIMKTAPAVIVLNLPRDTLASRFLGLLLVARTSPDSRTSTGSCSDLVTISCTKGDMRTEGYFVNTIQQGRSLNLVRGLNRIYGLD